MSSSNRLREDELWLMEEDRCAFFTADTHDRLQWLVETRRMTITYNIRNRGRRTYTSEAQLVRINQRIRTTADSLAGFIMEARAAAALVQESVCHCGEAAHYRCSACHTGLLCRSCVVDAHADLPCHRIQDWFSGLPISKPLNVLGMVVHLGHEGQECGRSAVRQLTVLAETGVCKVEVAFCGCSGADSDAKQVESMGWIRCVGREDIYITEGMLTQYNTLQAA
ncbi:hypothetical protein C8R43DRAFT_1130297 [Mycena crocata]|nr:hypothetical protein C8R43DRAFT_1130297 [Mycena crocata]